MDDKFKNDIDLLEKKIESRLKELEEKYKEDYENLRKKYDVDYKKEESLYSKYNPYIDGWFIYVEKNIYLNIKMCEFRALCIDL